ncbi:MAG: transposase [Lachnospiraceae bacterium]
MKEAKVKPYYGRYLSLLTLQEADPVPADDKPYACAIDFGVDNFATIVGEDHSSVIYKGGAVLSSCQWFHKRQAKLISILTKGHTIKHVSSRQLKNLSYHHANFIKDQCHKISRNIIHYCLEHQIGTLVLGVNKLWKQETEMGKQNNQNFVSMPIAPSLRGLITYKALNAGIKVVEQEESYTSKADVTAGDYLPTYGVDDEKAAFSGTRQGRGLYQPP